MFRLANIRADQEKGEKAKVLREAKAELEESKQKVTAVVISRPCPWDPSF